MVHPGNFGREGEQLWRDPATVEAYPGLRAAQAQHHVSLAISRWRRDGGATVGGLEAAAGLARGRLSKLLRGHAHLSIRDLQAIEGVTGPILTTIDLQLVRSGRPRRQFRNEATRC